MKNKIKVRKIKKEEAEELRKPSRGEVARGVKLELAGTWRTTIATIGLYICDPRSPVFLKKKRVFARIEVDSGGKTRGRESRECPSRRAIFVLICADLCTLGSQAAAQPFGAFFD